MTRAIKVEAFLKIAVFALIMSSLGCQNSIVPNETPYPTQTLYPTYTYFPTLTPAINPQPSPTHQDVVSESFDNNAGCFGEEIDENRYHRVEGGAYVIQALQPDWVTTAYCDEITLADFVFEVEISTYPEFEGQYTFGVDIRESNGSAYQFLLGETPNKERRSFCIAYSTPERFTPLTNSPVFPNSCWNLLPIEITYHNPLSLKIIASGSLMEFYINDILITAVRDETIREGELGFVLITYDSFPIKVSFDNVRVTE